MTKRESMKIVIVGHVDHGKSTLIGRLLYDSGSLSPDRLEVIRRTCEEMGRPMEFAFVMDHLKEERERGITIDTAQTFFHTPGRDYVIIDAPGHKEFMKNMVTGASQAETSILVVDAHEGVKEQTKRHAYILGMLNLKKNIVVINKMDLVGYREERYNAVKKEIEHFCARCAIFPSHIVPASAVRGDNFASRAAAMEWYSGPTVFEALDLLEKEERIEEKPLRMPVQDIYEISGEQIVVGRIEAGRVAEGDEIVVVPGGCHGIVDRILEYGRERDSGETGECVGVIMRGVEGVRRGQCISSVSEKPGENNRVAASIFWMAREPLEITEEITMRLHTQEVRCTVTSITNRMDSSTLDVVETNAQRLEENEVGEIVLNAGQPVVYERFSAIPELGRFVLERDNNIVAGGIITHE